MGLCDPPRLQSFENAMNAWTNAVHHKTMRSGIVICGCAVRGARMLATFFGRGKIVVESTS